MMEIRFCSLCGTERWADAAFCGGCGAAFVSESDAIAEPDEVPAEPLPAALADPPQPLTANAPADPPGTWMDEATAPFEHARPAGSSGVLDTSTDAVDIAADRPVWPVYEPFGSAPAPDAVAAPPAWQPAGRVPAVRISPIAIGFAALGMVLVAAGCVLVGAGIPEPGVAYAPLATGDLLGSRLSDATAMVAAVVSAAAALLTAILGVRRAVGPGAATGLLLVFGAVGIGLGILTATSAGWTVAGDVLPGPILMITGSAAALAGAVGGWIARE
jgi:hypothetical protein